MPLPPDHPKHGTRRGYQLGCREECCRHGNYLGAKLLRLRTQEHGPMIIDATQTREVLLWWDARGVALDAVGEAAGLCPNNLHDIARGEQPKVHRDTLAAIKGVTFDHLPGTSSINANVTRARIFSMMADGNELLWIAGRIPGFTYGGKWRSYPRVKISVARAVRDLYRVAPVPGPSKHTANRTRNQGHLPSSAWDDPGTLAEPSGWAPFAQGGSGAPVFDEATVLRRMAGDMTVTMHRAESEEVVRRLAAQGYTLKWIEGQTGLQSWRYRHVLLNKEAGAA